MSGIADSLNRSQQNIDAIAGTFQNYYKQKRQNEDRQNFYNALNQRMQASPETKNLSQEFKFPAPPQESTGLSSGLSDVINKRLTVQQPKPDMTTILREMAPQFQASQPWQEAVQSQLQLDQLGDTVQQRRLREAQIANTQAEIKMRENPIAKPTNKGYAIRDTKSPNGFNFVYTTTDDVPAGAIPIETANAEIARAEKPADTYEQTVVDESKVPVIVKGSDGSSYNVKRKIDRKTGKPIQGTEEYTPLVRPLSSGTGEDIPEEYYGMNGKDLLEKLNKENTKLAQNVKGMSEYITNPATFPTQLRRGQKGYTRQQMVAMSQLVNPAYDEKNFPAIQGYLNDLTKGGRGRRVTSLNTVITHLGEGKAAADKIDSLFMDYGKGGIFTSTANTIGELIAKAKGDPRVTQFNNVAERLADELATFYKGGNASSTDIGQEKERILNEIRNTPASKNAYLETTLRLLGGAIASEREGYEQKLHRPAPKGTFLLPTAEKALKKLKKDGLNFEIDKFDPSLAETTNQFQKTQDSVLNAMSDEELDKRLNILEGKQQ